MKMTLQTRVKLNNGVEIPVLGLGVWQAGPGAETRDAVKSALEIGYRHIDTAMAYKNEKDVGRAVRESGIPRGEIFITTKLWNADHGYDKALRAFQASLDNLGMDYIDLYLIHWPVQGLRGETWKALTTLCKDGRCCGVGVSNFTVRHLRELLDSSPVTPAIDQVEFSPFLYQKDLLDFCVSRGIRLEAYSPLTRGAKFKDPAIAAMSAKYDKTPAQILIRWALEHELVVIPKSVHPERIRENAGVFDFSFTPEDMRILDGLNENFRKCWDPTNVE